MSWRKHNRVWILSVGLAMIIAILMSLLSVPCSYGLDILRIIGDVSVALFGIFGIWLSLCHNDNLLSALDGKSGDELKREARKIWRNAERVRVLYNGLAISTVVFLVSLLFRISYPLLAPVLAMIPSPCIRTSLKFGFFSFVFSAVVAQIYSLLSPVAVMADSYRSILDTRETAERLLK